MKECETWFFGTISRADATKLLLEDGEVGAFLVRESSSAKGDLVLTVKEAATDNDKPNETKVSHFIINRVVTRNPQTSCQQVCFKFGQQLFGDITDLLSFYYNQKLDTTHLTRPVKCTDESLRGNRTFHRHYLPELHKLIQAKSISPIPQQSSILQTVTTDSQTQTTVSQSSTSSNSSTSSSLINSPVLTPRKVQPEILIACDEFPKLSRSKPASPMRLMSNRTTITENKPTTNNHVARNLFPSSTITTSINLDGKCGMPKQRKLPALAKAIQSRIPNAYDKTALTFKQGDIIKVTKIDVSGKWEGELNNKKGHFPFTHVEIIEPTYEPITTTLTY